jgi:hypothetical protein
VVTETTDAALNSVMKRPRRIPKPPSQTDQVKSYHLEGHHAAKGERDRERLLAAALNSSNERTKTIASTRRHRYPPVFQFCSTQWKKLK